MVWTGSPRISTRGNDGNGLMTSQQRAIRLISLVMLLGTIVLGATLACHADQDRPITPTSSEHPVEYPVTEIPLAGPISQKNAEVSGLAWYDDYLVLLPQYPKRLSKSSDGVLLAIPRKEILQYLAGNSSGAITPIEIPLFTGGIDVSIRGFEGFEAIDFYAQQVFLTIEAREGNRMMGYLVKGQIAADLSELRLDPESLVENRPQANLSNKSDETLILIDKYVVTLFEVNNSTLNQDPHASRFDLSLAQVEALPLAPIEYRITDAASIDQNGRFWVLNYLYPGDKELVTESDALALRYGEGDTHAVATTVERLVELQYNLDGITLTDTPPIQLQLLGDEQSRNWEGLARLEGNGFLLVTDEFPGTILGFVAYP